MGLYKKLLQKEVEHDHIKIGIIGVGQMGIGLISQISTIPGMKVTGICDHKIDTAKNAADLYNKNKIKKENIFISTVDKDIIYHENVDIIVDATGRPESGAKIAFESLIAKKHLVLLNVEVDITIGPLMKKLYDAANLIYTGSDGDEPACTWQLYEFASILGFEVLALGKGKNNKINLNANPDTVKEEAIRKNMSPKMLASFQDGTKTMAEMNLLSNATGFIPDITGMHGVKADLDGTLKSLRLKKDGGVLNTYGVVEYIDGLAPGVFAIIKAQNEEVLKEMDYMMRKDSDHHILYRPYHLGSLETPMTIARAIIEHEPAIVPIDGPISETVAVAKKDIKKGELIDGIGGYSIRGVLETHEEMIKNNNIPIGLIEKNTIAKKDIKNGEFLTLDNTQLDESTTVYRLRKQQDEIFV